MPDLRRFDSMGFRRQSATGGPALLNKFVENFQENS